MKIHWRETFLLTGDLADSGWTTYGEESWTVTREALDGGNGDLFTGTTVISLPEDAAPDGADSLVSFSVWNTQRDGSLFAAVRFRDPQNYYGIEYISSSSRLTVLLVKVLEGVRTVLQRADSGQFGVRIPDLTYGAGKASGSEITVSAIGNRICASVGAEVFLEATDNDLNSGSVALGHTDYHPFFDDITVYVPVGPEEVEEPGRVRLFRVAVPNRDEGNAIIMDMMEMGIGPAELVDEDESVFVSIGPLESRREFFDVRDYLDLTGYTFEEVKEGIEFPAEGRGEEREPPDLGPASDMPKEATGEVGNVSDATGENR
jgi:hypothetical protein